MFRCILDTHFKGEFLVERVNIHLTDGERKGLEMISEVTGIKKAELIRRAIDDYIRKRASQGVTGLHEFGAALQTKWIDDPKIVRQNIVEGLVYKENSTQQIPHFMGIDIGLKNDGSAITIGHWVKDIVNGIEKYRIEIDVCAVKYAILEDREFLEPAEIADWIISYTEKFPIVKGLMDQYYGMTVLPILNKKGLHQFEFRTFTEQYNSNVYQTLYTDLVSSVLRIPEFGVLCGLKLKDYFLVEELLTLLAEKKSKYLVKISAPDGAHCHDDLSDSLARMVFIAHEHVEGAAI
jgi:hypothetical protein